MSADRSRTHLADVRSVIEARLAPMGVLTPRAAGPLVSIGDGDGVVVVRLKPDAATIAKELKRDFGDAVCITVGFKPFPFGDTHLTPRALERPAAGKQLSALRVTCEISSPWIPRGDSATGRVVLQNSGRGRVEWPVSAGAGWLCRPRTLDVAGGYSGAITGALRLIELDAGGVDSLNFIVGTASCEPNDRYLVDAGSYEVVVPLSVQDASNTGDPARLLARDCFVTVTDAELPSPRSFVSSNGPGMTRSRHACPVHLSGHSRTSRPGPRETYRTRAVSFSPLTPF